MKQNTSGGFLRGATAVNGAGWERPFAHRAQRRSEVHRPLQRGAGRKRHAELQLYVPRPAFLRRRPASGSIRHRRSP